MGHHCEGCGLRRPTLDTCSRCNRSSVEPMPSVHVRLARAARVRLSGKWGGERLRMMHALALGHAEGGEAFWRAFHEASNGDAFYRMRTR